jgi:hypothetical protein
VCIDLLHISFLEKCLLTFFACFKGICNFKVILSCFDYLFLYLFNYFGFGDRVLLGSPGWCQSLDPPALPPECWDCSHEPPCTSSIVILNTQIYLVIELFLIISVSWRNRTDRIYLIKRRDWLDWFTWSQRLKISPVDVCSLENLGSQRRASVQEARDLRMRVRAQHAAIVWDQMSKIPTPRSQRTAVTNPHSKNLESDVHRL